MFLVAKFPAKMEASAFEPGWPILTSKKLAIESAVGVRTIYRIEAQDGLPNATAGNLRLIRETLQAAGIEFIGDAGEWPGVRLWSKPDLS